MALNPLIPISKSLSVVKSVAGVTQKTLGGISNILTEKNKDRKVISSNIKILKQKRITNTKRQNMQDVISAPTLVTRYKGPTSLAQKSDNTSFTSRIIGFIGFLSAGWALSNLPTWAAIGDQLIKRIQQTSVVVGSMGGDIVNFITDIGGLFNAAFTNIKQFDFTDNSGLLRSSLDSLSVSIMDMGDKLEEALTILTQPFLDVPPIGSRSEKPSAYDRRPPEQPSVSGGNPDFWLLSLISLYENSNPQGAADVAQSIYNRMGYSGRTARQEILARNQYEPVGKFGKTSEWNKVVDRDSAIAHIKKYPGNAASVSGLDKVAAALTNTSIQQSAAKFVGNRPDFRSQGFEKQYNDMTNDSTRYGQTFGFNRGSAYLGRSTTAASVPDFSVSTAKITPTLPSGFDPNKRYNVDQMVPSGSDVGAVVTSRRGWRWGKMHGGIDISMPVGSYITCKYPCIIKEARYEYGYGYYLDVVIPVLSIRIRLAHLTGKSYFFKGYPSGVNSLNIQWPAGKPLVKSGNTGRSTGPHVHMEATKNMNGVSYGGSDSNAVEPDPYVDAFVYSSNPPGGFVPIPDNKDLKGKPGVTPTSSLKPDSYSVNVETSEGDLEINSASLETFGKLLQSLSTEQNRRKVVIIDDRKPVSTPMILSGGDTTISSDVNEFTLVNNFMKNKLLLDLTYL